jgi:putative peptidoglycan lipid II flippase
MSGVTILARAFYSRANTRTPAWVAAACLGIGLIFAIILMFPLKHVGLALASSLASVINFFWLAYFLKRQGDLAIKPFVLEIIRYSLWSLAMGLAICPLFFNYDPTSLGRLLQVSLGLCLGLGVYFLLAIVFRCPHLAPLRKTRDKFMKKLIKRR